MVSDNQLLLDALRRETNPTSQSTIIEQIGARGIVAAVEPLIAMVRLHDYQSGPAIAALGNIGDPRAVPVLLESFARQNLAWIAKDALVKIGDAAVEPVIGLLETDNQDIHFAALRTLGELCDPRAITPLQAYVAQASDPTNRRLAHTTLKTLLLHTLTDRDPGQRLHAVQGLARLNDARTVNALERIAAADRDTAVRAAARETITALVTAVDHNPFVEYDLRVLSRETRLAINMLQRDVNRPIPLPDKSSDPAATLNALQTVSASADGAMTSEVRRCVLLLASDCLRHPAAAVRLIAIQGLDWLASDDAQRLLEPVATHDPDPAVRDAARAVLTT